jgi:hypothetical protein
MLLALRWPASEKRQGTKSREVVRRSGSERYGDLNFTPAAIVCAMPTRRDRDGCARSLGERQRHFGSWAERSNGRSVL